MSRKTESSNIGIESELIVTLDAADLQSLNTAQFALAFVGVSSILYSYRCKSLFFSLVFAGSYIALKAKDNVSLEKSVSLLKVRKIELPLTFFNVVSVV